MFAFDPNSFLTASEELDCQNTIESLLSADEKIDYYLWYLKYKILRGKKKSLKFGTFAHICRYLCREHKLSFSLNSCYDRALTYEEKRIIADMLGINISHLPISQHALQELRKIKDLATKELVLKKALKNVKNNPSNQITEPDIKNALREVKREGSVQLKLIDGGFIGEEPIEEEMKQKQSRVGQVYRLNISGTTDANLNLEEKFELPQYQTEGEFIEFTITEDTTAESDTSRNSLQPHNQAVNFYDNRIYEWKGMRFRSQSEIAIAYVLDRLGITFCPNSIVRVNDPNNPGVRVNKEVDFLIFYQGNSGILEVDGPQHEKYRVEEQERDRMFRHIGIRVIERYAAKKCKNQPYAVVAEFLKLLRTMHPPE